MRKLITNYGFTASSKEVKLLDYATIALERILLITDTTNNVTIYQANDPNKGGTVHANILTLTYDTTVGGFSDSDALQIFVEPDTDQVEVTNFPATQPVSGSVSVSNFPATQPVSASSLPLPTGAATSALQTTGNSSLSTIATNTSSIALTQASTTSGQLGNLNLGAVTTAAPSYSTGTSNPLSMTTAGALRTDGSATTQPVSGTVTANAGTGNFTVAQSTASNLNAQVVGSVAVGSAASGNPVRVGGSDGTNVRDLPVQVKATQTTYAVTTQDLKDAGRTSIIYYANAVTSGATTVETAITLTRSAGTAATTTGTSFVITSGKTFRITSISVATRGSTNATAQITTFNLRVNNAGAVTTTSTPIIAALASATPATALAWGRYFLQIPEGYEIQGNGTIQFGITAAAVFTTNAPTWYVTIVGYEY